MAKATKRLASQRRRVAAKAARKALGRPAERIMQGLADAATFVATEGKQGGEWAVMGDAITTMTAEALNQKMREVEVNARYEAANRQMREQNDDIVCSMMSVVQHGSNMPRHAPWQISGAEMRALIEVLERAGYTGWGKRDTAAKGPSESEVAKAS